MVGKIEKITLGTEKHNGDVTCMVFYNNNLFSGGADGKIKIWDTDLKLVKTIDAHEAYIYAIAVNAKGRLYSSSADGIIKYFENPLNSDNFNELLKTEHDEIESLYCVDEILYSGDDKGAVTKWVGNKIQFKYSLVEEVRSLAVEKNLIYTARDLDAVISEVAEGQSGKYSTKAVMPGRSPLLLIGPDSPEGTRKYLLFTTRDGKGIALVRNEKRFDPIWTNENAHEMIINAMCSTDNIIYTGGWDGIVKKWVEIDTSPLNAGDVTVGVCINTMCNGISNTIYVGGSDGMIRRVNFSSIAA